jgi:transposase-like protein
VYDRKKQGGVLLMVLPESSTFCKGERALKQENVMGLKSPGVPVVAPQDALTDVLREGTRQMLAAAVEAEVLAFLSQHESLSDAQGRQRVVRNGYLPKRTIQTGLGDIAVKAPRVRDRAGAIKFTSAILPPYLRRTRTLEELLPWLYFGVSTGDFSEALTALLGQDAPGLSASTIGRLKESWKEEQERWAKRSLAGKQYVYLWADGVHFGVRLEDASQCMLVLIGATAEGKKELLAIIDGYRESAASWKEVLLDVKARGMLEPKLAVGDGALGFWKALPQVFGHTKGQRCWVHKTVNVLNKLPKSQQPKAKAALHEI